jgi:hypothetical protein
MTMSGDGGSSSEAVEDGPPGIETHISDTL